MGGAGDTEKKQTQLSAAQEQQMNLANQQSAQTYNLTFPWLKQAGNYYSAIASGDPEKIFQSIAPASEQIAGQAKQAKESVLQNTQRGGVQQLALDQIDQGKAGQIGNLATQAYTSSFPALASLSQGGMGLSISELANAIGAGGQAGQTLGAVGNEQQQGKASTMGFMGSLAEAGGQMGAAAISKCWIAAELYGEDSKRFHLARNFIFSTWKGPVAWVTRNLYLKFGKDVAMLVRQHQSLKRILKPIFDKAVYAERQRITLAGV